MVTLFGSVTITVWSCIIGFMIIEKFDHRKHSNLSENLGFYLTSAPVYLDFGGYILERNGHKEIVSQDEVYPHRFPYLYLPHRDNWENSDIYSVTDEQLAQLKQEVEVLAESSVGDEFIYRTNELLEMKGKEWTKFRKYVNKFEKDYKYKVSETYPIEKVKEFCDKWLASQKEKTPSFKEGYDFFNFCLDNMEKYKIKTVFVEVDKELAGLGMGVEFGPDKWIGLHNKVDYKYKGLGRFLKHKQAGLFKGKEFFTLGNAGDKGIEQFKMELNPCKLVKQYHVITGKRLDKKTG